MLLVMLVLSTEVCSAAKSGGKNERMCARSPSDMCAVYDGTVIPPYRTSCLDRFAVANIAAGFEFSNFNFLENVKFTTTTNFID